MSLRVHNSLSRTLEDFQPLVPGQVRMYVCGITVYDLCHMGHLRMNMAFDVIYRWLRASGYAVTYVRNVTDIDDKIIKRAVERGITIRQLTEEMTAAMHEDFAAVGLLRPDHEPRATEYVPQMLSLIERLEQRGLAYRAEGGDVNYAVRKFDGYGKLSGKSIDDLRAGERVAVDDGKLDPLDFVLWKAAKAEEPADAKWAAPFGEGRPGWHIECSAMSCALLRHPWRRHRPAVPAPRERDRAEPGCRLRLRQVLAAQRLPERRRREDVQEPGQLLHHPRRAEEVRRRDAALLHAAHALPPAVQLQRRPPGRRAHRADAALHGAGRRSPG
jgi:hypothetical protein